MNPMLAQNQHGQPMYGQPLISHGQPMIINAHGQPMIGHAQPIIAQKPMSSYGQPMLNHGPA